MDNGLSDKLEAAIGIVIFHDRASTSFLQRRLGISYQNAAKLMDILQEQGVVAPPNNVGKREVLFKLKAYART